MMRFSLRTIVTGVLTLILVLATTPVFLAAAQTPAADHEAHHPGTPAAGAPASAAGAPQAAAVTTDPCAAITSTPPSGMPQSGMMGTPPLGGGGMADMMGQFDLMFIDMMIPHHAGAVAMAQVALTRAEHPELRALAEQIIVSQSAEIAQMQTWREQWFPDAPAMPMEEMMGMMGEMMGGPMGQMMGEMMGEMMPSGMMPSGMMPGGMPGTPGAGPGPSGMGMGMIMDMGQEIAELCATTEDFDLAFIAAMIPHHQMAVMMATMATMRAEHPELRDLTQKMVEDQQREISQMQAWRGAWSGAATPAASSGEAVAREAIVAVNEAMAAGETTGLDAIFAPDVAGHPPHRSLVTGEPFSHDLTGLKASLADMRHVFPDATITIDDLITSGDTVAARVTFRGTPDAAVLGLGEDMSHPLEIGGLLYGQIVDSRIKEFWAYFDLAAYFDLVGVLPSAAMATPVMPAGYGAATPSSSAQTGAEPIAVTLTEFSVTLMPTTLNAGHPYTFVVTNEGTVAHEFVIERTGATHEPLVAGGQMAMVEGIAPGESRTLEWTFTDPGSYQLACHEPGHYEAGQVLVIEVAD